MNEGPRCRDDKGDAGPLELVILMPAVLLLFALVVAFGRTSTANGDVEHAARVGARAAAGAQTIGGAQQRAETVVAQSLQGSGLSCVDAHVNVSGDVAPGGQVTVSVSCVADLGDVVEFGVPGSKTLQATATEQVDVVRGGG
jgi:Flp pilus assembly protein TadG